MALSPDGKYLAAREYDQIVHLWDVATGKRILDFRESHDWPLTELPIPRMGSWFQ